MRGKGRSGSQLQHNQNTGKGPSCPLGAAAPVLPTLPRLAEQFTNASKNLEKGRTETWLGHRGVAKGDPGRQGWGGENEGTIQFLIL